MNNTKKIIKDFLPIFREVGAYSKNPRNLEKEFFELQEPDPDDPEAWLNEERNEQDFKEHAKSLIDKIYKDSDLDSYQIYIGGQSHIDVAWRWRYWQTLRKVIVTYKKAAFHVHNHQNYTFVSSQPLLLEWILYEDPPLFKKIQDSVKKGRFDLCGGLYVEPDCHIPSGEGFIRQRLYGQRFYLKHFNKLSIAEWIPDSFGYANNLPQIFLKSGSKYFMTTKLTGNRETRFPFINFLWESPDGSQILTYLNPGGLGALTQHSIAKRYRRVLKEGAKLIVDYTSDKPEDSDFLSDEIPPIAAFIGKGDGGHGPTGYEVALMDELCAQKGAKWITASEFFSKILEKYRNRLPIWRDELYYEFHRGTLTTQGLVKRMNRFFEWRLSALESLVAILSIFDKNNEKYQNYTEKLKKVWKWTLLNQFHDVLPGSSIPEVYDDVYDLWDYSMDILNDVESGCWKSLIGIDSKIEDKITDPHGTTEKSETEKYGIFAYNGTGLNIKDFPIEIEIEGENELKNISKDVYIQIDKSDGTSIIKTAQIIKEDEFPLDPLFLKRKKRIAFVADLNDHSFLQGHIRLKSDFNAENSMNEKNELRIEEKEDYILLENQFNILKLDKKSGNIVSIFSKMLNREMLEKEGIALKLFYDWVPDEQCWNLIASYRSMPIEIDNPRKIQIVEKGPVKITVEVEREIFNEDSESKENEKSLVKQHISIYNGSPGIFIDFLADWHTCEALLKLDINTTTEAEYTITETPYATIKRMTEPIAYHDKPRWENVMQTWLDLPSKNEKWGLAVINNCKYGFDNKKGKVGITLLRGPLYPSPSSESWVIEERANRKKIQGDRPPIHADLGSHLIQLVVIPYKNQWNNANPNIIAFAHAFNYGIISKIAKIDNEDNIKKIDSEFSKMNSIIKPKTDNIELSVIKIAEDKDGIIIRVNEIKNQKSNAVIAISPILNVKELIETDLLERNIGILKKELGSLLKSHGDLMQIIKNDSNSIIEVHFKMLPHEIKTFKLQFK
ncbi:MAG: alpha-mannosidase [Promethearchaeota archaeon]